MDRRASEGMAIYLATAASSCANRWAIESNSAEATLEDVCCAETISTTSLRETLKSIVRACNGSSQLADNPSAVLLS